MARDEAQVPGDASKRLVLTEEEARLVIPVAAAAIDREARLAEQQYVRARNLVALVATLFVGAQAALVTSVGRPAVALAAVEWDVILGCAAVGAVALSGAVIWLFAKADQTRPVKVVDRDTIFALPAPPRDDEPFARLLAEALLEEQVERAGANRDARGRNMVTAGIAAVAGIAGVVQVVLLLLLGLVV